MPNKDYGKEYHKRQAEKEAKHLKAMNEALAEPDAEKRAELIKKLNEEAK